MKFIESYNGWKNLNLIIEAVVNIDSDIISIIKSYQNNSNTGFAAIANQIMSVIGKDLPKNRYDLVSLSKDTPSEFSVTMGRQVNAITIAKVINNLLVVSGVNPNAPIPKEDIQKLVDEKGITEEDAKKEIKSKRLIKQDTIQKFADELIGVIKLKKEKSSVTSETQTDGYKIVSGEDIIKYYSEDMLNKTYKDGDKELPYYSTELLNSCMVNKKEHLKLYALNPDKIRLVVKLVNGKVDARALLWNLSNTDYDYFLDRVYFNSAEERSALTTWVRENVGSSLLTRPERVNTGESVMVVLDNVIDGINLYPYLDTFEFLYIKREGDKLVNEGFVSSDKIDSSEFKDYVPFSCRDTQGRRFAVYAEDRKFENPTLEEIVIGSNVEYNIEGEFQDLEMLKRYYDMSYETLLKTEMGYKPDGAFTGLPGASLYIVAPDLLVPGPSSGGVTKKIPKFGVILIRDVTKIREQNPPIKTKLDGEYSYVDFKSLHNYFGYGTTWNAGYERIRFDFLTDLDCRILGIYDLVKDQSPMYYPHEFIYDDYGDDVEMNRKFSVMEYLFKTKEKEKLFNYKNAISDPWYPIEKEDIEVIIKDNLKPAKPGLVKRFKDFIGFKK